MQNRRTIWAKNAVLHTLLLVVFMYWAYLSCHRSYLLSIVLLSLSLCHLNLVITLSTEWYISLRLRRYPVSTGQSGGLQWKYARVASENKVFSSLNAVNSYWCIFCCFISCLWERQMYSNRRSFWNTHKSPWLLEINRVISLTYKMI